MPSAAVSEVITLTESHLGDIAPAFRGTGETITVSESVTMGHYTYPMVLGRTTDVTVTETVTLRLPILFRLVTESVTVAETLFGSSPGSAITVSVVDALSVGETNARTISPSRIAVSDAVGLTESLTGSRGTSSAPLSPQVSETLAVTESHLGDVAPAFRGEGETVTVTETATVSFLLGRLQPLVSDAIAVGDVPTVSMTGSTATLRPSVVDRLSVAETVTRAFPSIAVTGTAETITLSESVGATIAAFLPGLSATAYDVIDVTDTLINAYVSPTVWTFGERIIVTDAVRVRLVSFIRQSETVTVGDTPRLRITPLRVGANDIVTLVEALIPYVKDDASSPLIVLPTYERVTVTESVGPWIPFSLTVVSDSIGITEVVTIGGLHVFVSGSESITLTESVTVSIAALRVAASDAVALAESVAIVHTPLIVAPQDLVTLTEAVEVRSFDLRPTVTDMVTVREPYVYGDLNPGTAPVSTFVGPWFLYAHLV